MHVYRKFRFYVLIASVCAVLSYITSNKGWDPLIFKYGALTGYAWSHFAMYTLIGFINLLGDEHAYEHALFLSFVWEYLEVFFGYTSDSIEFWTSGGITGQMQDVAINMGGFFVGRHLRKVVPCKIKDCSSKLLVLYETMAVSVVAAAIIRFNYKLEK